MLTILAAVLAAAAGASSSVGWLLLPASVLIKVSAAVRRLHDHGYTGWLALAELVPVVGSLFILVVCGLLPGDSGGNRFGPPPGNKLLT